MSLIEDKVHDSDVIARKNSSLVKTILFMTIENMLPIEMKRKVPYAPFLMFIYKNLEKKLRIKHAQKQLKVISDDLKFKLFSSAQPWWGTIFYTQWFAPFPPNVSGYVTFVNNKLDSIKLTSHKTFYHLLPCILSGLIDKLVLCQILTKQSLT